MGALKDHYFGDTPAHFDGATYEPKRDQARLFGQLERVRAAMSDRQWHTLEWLVAMAGGTVASVSARLRDLRKAEFGAHIIERRNAGGGLFEYRMIGRKSS